LTRDTSRVLFRLQEKARLAAFFFRPHFPNINISFGILIAEMEH